jgi:serine/threonine protein kinase
MLKKIFSLCIAISLWVFNFSVYANYDGCINVLDTDGSFESELKTNFSLTPIEERSSINLELLSSNTMEALYLVSRQVSENTDANGINNTESYLLRIFKQKYINREDIRISIREPIVYSSFYTNYYLVDIRNNITSIDTEGLLPFLNINNLAEFKQIFTMGNVVSRQLELQSSLEHDNILGTFTVQNNVFINKPDDTLLNYIFNSIDKHNINEILKVMYSIASAVEYLHSKDIAHGDITLNNLFIKDNNVVLSGFERFNISNSPNIKLKEFDFSNDFCHAPEIRKPANNKFTTSATSYGDVFSLGIVFSVMLHFLCSDDLNLSLRNMIADLSVSPDKFLKFAQQQKLNKFQLPEILSYNHSFFNIKKIFTFNTIDTTLISTVNSPILKYLFDRCEYPTDIMQKLLNIIDFCHARNIEYRPSAAHIKEQISNLIAN